MNEASEKIYHIVISSKRGLLCRDGQDYTQFENYIAFSALRSSCRLLAHSTMSTHAHIAIITDGPPKSFIKRLKKSYTSRFNAKYSLRGPVCAPKSYCREVHGEYAVKALICYILRNSLHHGVTEIPFQYAHSSIKAYFRKELRSWNNDNEKSAPVSQYIRMRTREGSMFLPVDGNGRILLSMFVNSGRVEYLFRSVRSFLHSMLRWNTEDWEKEQKKENPAAAVIDLNESEPYTTIPLDRMRAYERGVFRLPVTDCEICEHLDKLVLPRMGILSFAHVSQEQRNDIIKYLCQQFHISRERAVRFMI